MQIFVNRPPVFLEHLFHSTSTVTLSSLQKEPSMRSCSDVFLSEFGGSLAKQALDQTLVNCYTEYHRAKEAGLSAICDVRTQMLMPEMFPSIPGWHCDAVPRDNYHGQPTFEAVHPRAFHVCLTLSSEKAGVSNTEYVMDAVQPKIWDDAHVYRELHTQVEKIKPRVRSAPDGVFVKFWPKTVHRAAPVHRRGIRMFFRFSMVEKPVIQNVKNAPQQVYLLSERNGW
jgi:hypothetical protein